MLAQKMKTPKAVVFDLGKVLVDFDYAIAVDRISAYCADKHCDLAKIVGLTSPILLRYETGLITTEVFFEEVRTLAGFSRGLTDFSEMFADIFSPIEPMVEVNEHLRARGIPTYIFSNTNPLAVSHIRSKFPFFRNFTAYILSYEHGCMKPDARIYEIVEKDTGKKGADILYLDDRQENVEAGAARGWQTILHSAPEDSRKRMRELALI